MLLPIGLKITFVSGKNFQCWLRTSYEVAEYPINSFVTWTSKNPPLIGKLEEFLSSKHLPTIRLEANLAAKFEQQSDLYGVFDPDDTDYIYLDSSLIKKAQVSHDYSLSISFLIFSKVLHEVAHWITHFTMKKGEKICTPVGYFNEEAGEFMEKAIFGGIVSHHSKSAFCPWEVELIIKDKVPGSNNAEFFHTDYMKLFFNKETVDQCVHLHNLRATAYITPIQDKMLAIVTLISTNDELVKPIKKGKYDDGYTTTISLSDEGKEFKIVRDVLVRKAK